MSRQVTRPPPQISRRAASTAAVTAECRASNALQGTAVSNVSTMTPSSTRRSRSRGAALNAFRQESPALLVDGSRRRPAPSTTAAAASSSPSTGCEADSAPSTSRAPPPGTPLGSARRRFDAVDQAAGGGSEPALQEEPDRVGPRDEAVRDEGGAGPVLRAVLHPEPGLGDHSERALAAEQHPVRARPRPGAGQAAGLPPADGGARGDRFDEVVDVLQRRGVVAGRTGGQPAPDRRLLVGLREEAEAQTVRAEGGVSGGPERARCDAGGPARAVDLEHAGELLQIQRDHRPLDRGRDGPDSTDHTAAATEGDDPGAGLSGPGQDLLDLSRSRRADDQIRRRPDVAVEAAQQIEVGAADRVTGAVDRVLAAEVGQRRGELDARRGELAELTEPRFGQIEAERLLDEGPELGQLLGGRRTADGVPAPDRVGHHAAHRVTAHQNGRSSA